MYVNSEKKFLKLPSVLWCCWLGGKKGIWSVKTEWRGAGVVMCLGQGTDLCMVQLMPLPLTTSCSGKSRLVLTSWFYLSGAGSPGWSRTKSKRAVDLVLNIWILVLVLVLRLPSLGLGLEVLGLGLGFEEASLDNKPDSMCIWHPHWPPFKFCQWLSPWVESLGNHVALFAWFYV